MVVVSFCVILEAESVNCLADVFTDTPIKGFDEVTEISLSCVVGLGYTYAPNTFEPLPLFATKLIS